MADLSDWWISALSGSILGQTLRMRTGVNERGRYRPAPRALPSLYRLTSGAGAPRTLQDSFSSDHLGGAAEEAAAAPVLGAELFRSALSRERRRADRFEERFALLTIAVDELDATALAVALRAAARETDIVGWLEPNRTLGLLTTQIDRGGENEVRQTAERFERELRRRSAAVEPITPPAIRSYVHQSPGSGNADGLCDADPLLHDLSVMGRRKGLLDGCKRLCDIFGSLALLALLSPVFLLVAVLVKLTSPGPVLFSQVRVGQLAKPFTMLKFRTMHVNNDSAVHQQFVTEFIRTSEEQKHRNGTSFFKIQNDPRVTLVGHFLRRTSLDELPQLWNVLRGDMSLVGPRPPLPYELEQYRPWHWRRVLEGRPGLTGLWQVVGRSRTTFDEMVRLDVRYLRTRSLWTDVKILVATPRAVVTGKGAC